MLQTDKTTSAASLANKVSKLNSKANIVKRLEDLNKWQEDRKKMLEAKQTMQRHMLGMEQRTMYQALGLQCDENLSERAYQDFEGLPESEIDCNDDQNINPDESVQNSAQKTHTSGYDTEDHVDVKQAIPKKPYLRKGQGLKRRFGIDPEKLRITNLPKYKFANAHSNLSLVSDPSLPVKLKLGRKNDSSPTKNTLDAQELRFQHLLISSKNVCNSTPDLKSSLNSNKTKSSDTSNNSANLPKVRFVDTSLASKNVENPSAEAAPQTTQTIAWAKILDPQQIHPTPILRKSPAASLPSQAEDDLFVLMEQKANEGSFDMDSSCIKRFMREIWTEKCKETDDIPVYENVKSKRLEPVLSEVAVEEESSSCLDNENEQSFASEENTEENDQNNIAEKTLESTDCIQRKERDGASENHVRFSESTTVVYPLDDTVKSSSSVILSEMSEADRTNPEFFEQFKNALFATLKMDQELDQDNENDLKASASEITLTPLLSQVQEIYITDLKQKTQMVEIRLEELDKEIDAFRENNAQLLKSKQLFEQEKARHYQEQLELEERMKDERIKLEIYLHDERMRMEDEKRKFEQQIKAKSQAATTCKTKEIEKLRAQLNSLEMQMKIKDANHAAAQARWRAKSRSMEKVEKTLTDQIDVMAKENKRLENEMLRITRENSNKLLQEINRNIAKLAPKQVEQAETSSPNVGLPLVPSRKSLSTTIVEKARANNLCKSPNMQKPKKKIKSKAKRPHYSNGLPDTTSSEDADNIPGTSSRKVKSTINLECNSYDEDDEDILKELQSLTPTERININTIEIVPASTEGPKSPRSNKAPPSSPTNMKREIINSDGSKDIWFSNGNVKKISPDGMNIRMLYFNKDIKETNVNEGTVKYYYAATNTWQTTYLDGLEILEYPNGQVEHRRKNGVIEVHYPNNSVKVIDPRDDKKQEEWRFEDGTHLMHMRNGDKILMLANGQKEVHTKLQKRREYPDGTVKIIYPDGSSETRYSNGRVRLKDRDGKLVMDTEVDG